MKKRIIILAILGAALLLRAGFLLESWRQNPTFFTPIIDSHTYDVLAWAQVSGEGMGPESVWQPLFYPYFLAAFYRVFGRELLLVRAVQVLVGLGTVYLTWLLGKMVFSFGVGAVAAGLVALSGPLIFYEGELLTGVWEVFWFLFSLVVFVELDRRIRGRGVGRLGTTSEGIGYGAAADGVTSEEAFRQTSNCHREEHSDEAISTCEQTVLPSKWLRLLRRCAPRNDPEINEVSNCRTASEGIGCGAGVQRRVPGWITWAGVGVVCGVGVIIRPTVLMFYLLAALWVISGYFRVGLRGWRRVLVGGGAFVLGVGLIFAPVLVRNYRVTGYPILMPTSGGLNFYIGNNPEAAETIATRPGEGWRQLTVRSREAGIYTQPYGSKYFYDQAFDYIRSHPLDFARGLLAKTALFFHGREVPRNLDIYLFREYSSILRVLVWRAGGFAFPMGIILPFTLLGMALCLPKFKKLFLLYLFAVVYPLAIILFFVTSRYRLPLLPVFSLFAAAAAERLYRSFRERRWRIFFPATAALILLFLFCNRPLSIPEDRIDFRSELYLSLGSVHLREDLDRAEAKLKQSIEQDPENAEGHYLLGVVSFRKERIDEAEERFRATLQLNPRHASAHKGLGRVYDRKENPEPALFHWRESARIDTGDAESRRRLGELYEDKGDRGSALREYWKALQLKPDDVQVRRRLAFLSGEAGNWAVAEELIAEALRHYPEDATLLTDLGVIYENTGRTREAIEAFRNALELDPNLAPARYNLELIQIRLEEGNNTIK